MIHCRTTSSLIKTTLRDSVSLFNQKKAALTRHYMAENAGVIGQMYTILFRLGEWWQKYEKKYDLIAKISVTIAKMIGYFGVFLFKVD